MNGDREGETADNIKEDMTASLKPRFFKMKKCVLVPRSTRNSAAVCAEGSVDAFYSRCTPSVLV